MKFKALTMVAASLFALSPLSASAVPVALELSLNVDVSGSVDASEYNLQRGGYVAAFQNAVLQANIASLTGGIAVQYVEWSGAGQQSVQVGWTHITDAASANNFAAAILATSRAFSGQTAPGSAINFTVPTFNNNGFEGARLVIDVSGDGPENDGANTFAASTAANAAGITINGLPIGDAGLATWYQNNIVTPGGGFLVAANGFNDLETATIEKVGREINGVPEPESMLLFGIGFAGMGFVRKHAKKA